MNTTYRILLTLTLLTVAICFANGQTANVTEGCVPLTVNFSPPTGQTAFFWDFKDGSAGSSDASPSHIFSSPGTYVVSLNEGATGNQVGTITITVLADIEVIIDATLIDPCNPGRYQFTNNSIVPDGITVTGYKWVFGDGSSSNQENPIHLYSQSGAKSISLELITDIDGCNNSKLFENLIDIPTDPALNAFFAANPNATCDVPATIFFVGGQTIDGVDYNWDFGDGSSSNDSKNTIHEYTQEGVYEVTLTLTNDDCETTFTRIISIGAPIANFGFNDTLCLNTPTLLVNNTAADSFQWTFPESVEVLTADNVLSPSVTFTEPGLVTINMVGQLGPDSDCIVDTTFQVFIQDPDVNVIIDPLHSCMNPYTVEITTTQPYDSYLWNGIFGGMTYTTTVSSPPRDSFYINEIDTIEYELVVTTAQGCVGTLVDYYYHQLPEAHFIPSVHHGCAPLSVTFQDTSSSYEPILTYTYDYGNGDSQTLSSNDDHSYTFNDPGEYLVTLIIENDAGCIDTSWAVLIEVGEQIAIDYELDQSVVCFGDTVTINAINVDPRIDAFNLSTDEGRSHHCEGESYLEHAFISNTGVFPIEYTVDYNGCRSILTGQDSITVNGPKADLWYMINCDDPLAVMFADSSQQATSILWTIGDTSGVSVTYTDSVFTHTFPESGDYTVYLEAFNDMTGCPSNIDSVVIHAREVVPVFDLPENLCDNNLYELDASLSIDVDNDCSKGYTWSFIKNGRPRQVGQDIIQHGFAVTGIDIVTLTVEDINGCTSSMSDTIDVFGIQPNFEFDKDPICFPADVTFTDLSTSDTTLVDWSYLHGANGLGSIQEFSTDPNTTESFDFFNQNLSSLPIFLGVEDALGCKDTIQLNIDVYKPLTVISADPEPICIGGEIEFVALDITNQGSTLDYVWDFDNGESSTDSIETVQYNTAGTYNITLNLTEESTGCQNEQSISVLVTDPPVAAFTGTNDGNVLSEGDKICIPANVVFSNQTQLNNNPVSYVWSAGEAGASTSSDPDFTFPRGMHEITLIATSDYGCADTISTNYIVVGAEGDIELSDNSICKGESITFSLKDTVGVDSWSWDFGFGEVFDNVDPIEQVFGEDLIGNQTIVTLSLQAEGIACEVIITKLIEFNSTDLLVIDTIVTEKGIDVALDTISNSDFLTVVDAPIPLACSTCSPPVVDSNTDSCYTYIFESIDKDNCSVIRYEITVIPVPIEIDVPNLFTPNGDGDNEFFRVATKIDTVKNINSIIGYDEFRVYNRWGETVYDNTNGLEGWDGTHDGDPVPPEVYGYYMIVRLVGGDENKSNLRVFKGDVTLLR